MIRAWQAVGVLGALVVLAGTAGAAPPGAIDGLAQIARTSERSDEFPAVPAAASPAAPAPASPGEAGGASGTAFGWLRLSDSARDRYAAEIREMSARYRVSPSLVEAVIAAESAFNHLAVSPKGARGLMQLMPQTAQALGVLDAFDPRQNIEGGVRHLRRLVDRYPGEIELAMAAYNAGEGAVDAHRGIPPFPRRCST